MCSKNPNETIHVSHSIGTPFVKLSNDSINKLDKSGLYADESLLEQEFLNKKDVKKEVNLITQETSEKVYKRIGSNGSKSTNPEEDNKNESGTIDDGSKVVVTNHNDQGTNQQKAVQDNVYPPCSVPSPEFLQSHERPESIDEAANLSKYFWQKALCYKSIDIDSCHTYTQKAITTYENGSLFTLKAYCLLKLNMLSASRIASDISLSRNDHWDTNDTKVALGIKIQVLEKINISKPSIILKAELEKSQNDYKSLYGND